MTEHETFCPAKSPAERSGFYAKMPFPRFLIRNLGNNNPETAHQLRTILNEISLKYLREKINELRLTRLTLDIDQTARAIHGLQEGARKGYSSKDKNSKLFQVAVWSIRETKTVINLELLTGEKHCANNFLNRLVAVLENLKTLGVKIRVICDSGYENIDVFEYLETERIEFLKQKMLLSFARYSYKIKYP